MCYSFDGVYELANFSYKEKSMKHIYNEGFKPIASCYQQIN